MRLRILPIAAAVLLVHSCIPVVHAALPPGPRRAVPVRDGSAWVDSVLSSLTLEEKVGQLMIGRAAGRYFSDDNGSVARLVRLVRQDGIGGLNMGQGDVYATAMLLNRLQRMAKVPLLVAADFERGVAMRVRRAVSFSDAMAIGATRDTTLGYRAGRAIAEEARAIGVHQNYAPVADINDNPDNPVINTRSFGDDPAQVSAMVAAFVRGTIDGGCVATAKHFPGHGSTGVDSHLALPVVELSAARLDSVELTSFRSAIAAGAKSVMIGHLAVPALDPVQDEPASLSAPLIDSLLRNRMGFHGLVVTDGLEMQAVSRSHSPADAAVRAFEAGADLLLNPADEIAAMNAIVRLVRAGKISEERLDQSVRRILELKQSLGLDRDRFVDVGRIGEVVGSASHRILAMEIARRGLTVIRNDREILPIRPVEGTSLLLVALGEEEDELTAVNRAGTSADVEPFGAYLLAQTRRRDPDVSMVRITPESGKDEVDALLRRARKADVVVVAVYVAVHSGTGSVGLPEKLRPFVRKLRSLERPTVVLLLGNPYLIPEFPAADALLCSYSDAEPAVEASVEAMFGEIDVHGTLPINVSEAVPYGTGRTLVRTTLRADVPEVAGFDRDRLERVGDIVRAAVRDSAFPGAQLAVIHNGILALNECFGTLTYDPSSAEVTRGTRYDLASLTKVIATTTAVMRLSERRKISLDDRVSSYIPAFTGGMKDSVTIRHLLTHRAGLPPFRQLWKFCPTAEAALDTVYATPLVAVPGDTTIYSDLGLIILGKIVEEITGMSLESFVNKEFYHPLGMRKTGFRPPESERARVAPTEIDSSWRMQLVQGTVHDENAAFLGGVSGHAGLFSTASDLAVFMQMLMNGGTYAGVRYLEDGTVRLFTQPVEGTGRALGWDIKSPVGSSAGSLFSSSSFGHTGFTGTSIWVDPGRKLCVILLTNRVCPTRANMKIAKVRPAVCDEVVRALVEGGPAQ